MIAPKRREASRSCAGCCIMMYPLQPSGAMGQISTIAASRFKQYWIVSEMMYVCNAHQALARRKRGTNLEQSR